MIRQAIIFAPLLVAAGCSCNNEYEFPKANSSVVEAPENFGSWLSLDAAPDGNRITMTYYDRDDGALGFAVGTPNGDGTVSWDHEQVDGYKGDDGLDRSDRGMYSSHKVAPDGTIWVAYHDIVNGGLYYGHRLGPHNWETDLVDAGNGHWASLALNADGLPVIAHQDADEGTLRVSRFDGTDWSTEEAWSGQPQEVATDSGLATEMVTANVGSYARILIEGDTEYIAFYDKAWGTLDLLEGNAGAYVHTVVDETGDAGQWPSMWLTDDTLQIAYHDVMNQDLVLGTRSGASWSREVIDAGEYVGADSEIFEMNGELAIVYFDGFNNDMKLGEHAGATWTTKRISGNTSAVGFHNEVVQVGQTTWLGSYDFTAQTPHMKRIQ